MPILAYTGGMWYGSASGALIDTNPTIDIDADIKGQIRLGGSIDSGLIPPFIKGTMGRKQTLSVLAIGELHLANWKKLARIALDVSIGASPSAYDIAQAVLNAAASSYNIPGTIGEKINDSGSASNPWATDLGGKTAGDRLKDADDQSFLASVK